ncbi:MAG: hypothetical protein LUC41_05265 [Clostridiales bacterium]|nr:hypothetical protein [Clostridiales bacterium]
MKKAMKITIPALAALLLLGLAGCGREEASSAGKDSSSAEECVAWETGSNYFFTEDGCYFIEIPEGSYQMLLYYFDPESGVSVPVCDKADCDHNPNGDTITCNAQIESVDGETFVVYRDKVYYIADGDRNLILRCRDTDGNNDTQVAVIDAPYMGQRMWFYRNKALIMATTDVSGSFDPETGESDDAVLCLFAVDLDSGNVETVAESSLTAAVLYAFQVYDMSDGQMSYYDLEKDKWYSYDVEDGSLTELDMPEGAKYGTSGEYLDIYGDYCYSCFANEVKRLDPLTGEETTIYAGNVGSNAGYMMHGLDFMCINAWRTVYSGGELVNERQLAFYDIATEELKNASDDFFDDFRICDVTAVSDTGFIYPYAVHSEDAMDVYDGDFEYRYSTIEDAVAGNGNYQVVWYAHQE